jgi:predicted DNA-binding transcriptional regulator AlpA
MTLFNAGTRGGTGTGGLKMHPAQYYGQQAKEEHREQQFRLYRFKDLRHAGVPFTRKHITTLEDRGKFPARVKLTEFSVAWVAAEIDHWVEERILAHRRQPKKPSAPEKGA